MNINARLSKLETLAPGDDLSGLNSRELTRLIYDLLPDGSADEKTAMALYLAQAGNIAISDIDQLKIRFEEFQYGH